MATRRRRLTWVACRSHGRANRLEHSSGLGWDDVRRSLVWLVIYGPSDGGPAEAYLWQRYRVGWPCRSLRAERWVEWTSDRFVDEWRGSWGSQATNIPRFVPAKYGVRLLAARLGRPLPYAPIWPGFVVNSLFYAALLWLLILGPLALRRLIRRRRGLCPACGYDLRHGEHEACPECGVTA